MIDGDAAFPQERFDIAITQGIPEIPPDRAQEDPGREMAPSE
jgi:hypothetical protein